MLGRVKRIIKWKISGKELLKTIALAAVVIGFVYIIVWFCKWAFNTDFRFWTPAVKTFTPIKLLYTLIYLPPFFLFYLANSLTVNGAARFEGGAREEESVRARAGQHHWLRPDLGGPVWEAGHHWLGAVGSSVDRRAGDRLLRLAAVPGALPAA